MFQVLKGDGRDVLAARFAGRLAREDIERFANWLESEMRERVDAGLLVVMEELEGYERWQAALSDLKADLRYNDWFAKIAVVGNVRWEEAVTKAAEPFAEAELRYFDAEEQGTALAWLRDGDRLDR